MSEIPVQTDEVKTKTSFLQQSSSIEIQNISFSYVNESRTHTVLRNINLSINAGETIAIVGRSGSGKSTLLRILAGMLRPDTGNILFGKRNISKYSNIEINNTFTLVPQNAFIFSRTVFHNVAYGRPDTSQESVDQALLIANALDFVNELNAQSATILTQKGNTLSSGQKQRIAIARAALIDRPVLLLDEATSALDSISETLIARNMATHRIGKTTIIVSHRLSTTRTADRIIVLNEGQISEVGTHSQLLKNNSLYVSIFRDQLIEENPTSLNVS